MAWSAAMRGGWILAALVSLVAGIAGGLARAGIELPASGWLDAAVAAHAFLMVCAFMGTVIGIERAIALKHQLAIAAPLASGLAGIALLAGESGLAVWLMVASSLAFIAVNIVVVHRQRATHTALLLVGAIAWAVGCLAYATTPGSAMVVPLWFAFLALTVAAERLEMTRLARPRPGAARALYVLVGALLVGALASGSAPVAGGLLYGLALVALAAWFALFDIARRTVRAHGLSRYMAVCLLLGYAWLGISGAAWVATSLGLPFRDAALHALALGFVFSMVLGHAPVILPAVARVKLHFGGWFYLPLALLHGSLLMRLLPGPAHAPALSQGAAGNALALAVFLATVAGSAIAWHFNHSQPAPTDHDRAAVDH